MEAVKAVAKVELAGMAMVAKEVLSIQVVVVVLARILMCATTAISQDIWREIAVALRREPAEVAVAKLVVEKLAAERPTPESVTSVRRQGILQISVLIKLWGPCNKMVVKKLLSQPYT